MEKKASILQCFNITPLSPIVYFIIVCLVCNFFAFLYIWQWRISFCFNTVRLILNIWGGRRFQQRAPFCPAIYNDKSRKFTASSWRFLYNFMNAKRYFTRVHSANLLPHKNLLLIKLRWGTFWRNAHFPQICLSRIITVGRNNFGGVIFAVIIVSFLLLSFNSCRRVE